MNLFHPITNPKTGECADPSCPCHEFALKTPSEASSRAGVAQDMETVKTASTYPSGSGMAIPAPDFEQEWAQAPESHRRYSYHEDAFYWFMRGVRCGELNQMIEENRVFKEMAERRGLTK